MDGRSVWDVVGSAEGPVGLLQRDAQSGRVAHAYLFSGVAGRLPLDAALAFSAALVCSKGGCGECEACLRALHRAHPDVEMIEPAGMQLLVEQVREAIRAVSRRPVAAPRRVIVVEGADRMNPTAQNAFLKALEEPPPSTTIVLLAPSPEALLDTVRSRCREVTFRTPARGEIAALLETQGVDPERARYCARVAGDLDRATALANDPSARALRAEIVARTVQPFADAGEALEAAEWLHGKTRDIRERVAAEHRAEHDAFHQWQSETKAVADQRLRREQRRAEQDALEASIDDVVSVLRDLLVLSKDRSADILNEDERDELVLRAGALSAHSDANIVHSLGEIEQSRRRLRANANVLLTLESVFLSLYRSLSGRAGTM